MNHRWRLAVRSVAVLAMLALVTACAGMGGGGGGATTAATLDDLPVFAGATALQPGEDPIADTLASNMQQDAALRESMGVGGGMEQRAYRLPAGTTWEAVKGFFDEELTAAGWARGASGPGGQMAADIMEQANAANDIAQTTLYSRGNQTLAVLRSVNPTSTDDLYLILSLNSN